MDRVLLFLCLGLFFSCGNQGSEYLSHRDFALDTTVSIKLYGIQNRQPLTDGMEEIRRLEELLSIHHEGSDTQRLASNAGTRWVDLSGETLDLLEQGIHYGDLSQGLLDITAAPLIELWAIDPPHGHIPTQEELAQTLPLVGYELIQLEGTQAYLPYQGMAVNFGAIAKGYIADHLKELYLREGITSGIINLGGNILLMGSKPGDRPFRIGIQDPQSERGENIGVVSLSDRSLVTSGDYERFFEDEAGNRYHHILNPFTGFPGEMDLQQVTVITAESVQGDALSTSLFLMGLDQAMALVEELDQVEGIFVTQSNHVYVSSGLKDSFEFRGSPNYTLVH